MKSTKSIFVLLLFLPLLATIIPTSNAEYTIIPGTYVNYEADYDNCKKLEGSYEITSGQTIDVFILTTAEYTLWQLNTTLDPITYVAAKFDTLQGSISAKIPAGNVYYLVFSNVHGSLDATGTFTYQCSSIPGFGCIAIFMILVTIAIGFYLLKKKSIYPS